MNELELEVVRRYRGGPTVAARLDLPGGEGPVTVLFGPSGAGKTTVLRCLAGLERPDAGAIRFRGETWFDAAAGVDLPPARRGVGLLFQDHALFPHLTVAANVGYGVRGVDRAERARRVAEVAARLGVEALLARRPGQLSGGERQRVALARALAARPRLLLLDEPLSALDAPAREALRGELRATLERAGLPSIVVTHDRAEAMALGDRLAVLAGGGVRQVGPVHEVFSAPADLEVARVVGTENVLPARVVERRDGLARVAVGRALVWALDPGRLEEAEAYACLRAEDVVLESSPAAATSARNELAGVVVATSAEGPLVRVTLDCGFRLVALVTRDSAERLGAAPGRQLAALVKAQAIRLVLRPR
ncbi:ABC transporter ATP-binding protein [Anaeromyxobacter diazotrophicus]|uniref:Sulfate ABC transporter ATP-binding protein n=1 Tax=Anaeromyxobacter diazotrophicus TaxID=2590199 RepID=A0A7I9VJ61_9BACT|nr:ABC transporter ATP-binding protein [Anaeromyxobacter diazotrophicus]GEJ56456.1 sulfate ABC transporter ATP-binding protein [Anaeromyxobacter diazotrophicus]